MRIESAAEAEKYVSSILRDEDIERRCLEAFADTVEEAIRSNEEQWAITCKKGKVRLQVGPVIICNIGDGRAGTERLWMALDRDRLAREGKTALLDTFEEWQWSDVDQEYTAVSTRNGYYVPSERHDKVWLEIRELHFESIRKAADRGGLRLPTKNGHSPGVLEYLRSTIGRTLPPPAYSD